MTYQVRDEERITCPWPVVQYVCPFDPSVEHWQLTLFAHVSLAIAEHRLLIHFMQAHNGSERRLRLSRLRRGQTHSRALRDKDGLTTGAYAQVQTVTQNASLVNGKYDILLAVRPQE